tara:strand:+ start:1590 stop:1901 length:312 start_codon:yes stop_codon:yes gene_type:complete
MAWLRTQLPLEEEFDLEHQARLVGDHEDHEELQDMASILFRQLWLQQNLTAQLIRQCAELELKNAKLEGKTEPAADYMEWATSLYPHDPPPPGESDLANFRDE